MSQPLRVAYTLEQCWHEVPGGTAVAALRIAERLAVRPDVELHAVAGKHRRLPQPPYMPPLAVDVLPIGRPWLYETWVRFGWPIVESVTGPVDVCHATGLVPAASQAPLVVTVHDLAFRRWPQRFSRHGVRIMERSLARIRERASIVICSSHATIADVVAAGIPDDRVRHVPLGVEARPVPSATVERVRWRYELPETFVLFVGTLEPRKNLVRLAEAITRIDGAPPLVVVGAPGWGEERGGIPAGATQVRFLGFVPDEDLPGLYAAATAFAYPSEWEGFGLPVAEAMAQGTPVVTSRGTSTEEVAGGAAILVDPMDTADLARGLIEALDPSRREQLAAAGLRRAAELTWDASADATVAAYRDAIAIGVRS